MMLLVRQPKHLLRNIDFFLAFSVMTYDAWKWANCWNATTLASICWQILCLIIINFILYCLTDRSKIKPYYWEPIFWISPPTMLFIYWLVKKEVHNRGQSKISFESFDRKRKDKKRKSYELCFLVSSMIPTHKKKTLQNNH